MRDGGGTCCRHAYAGRTFQHTRTSQREGKIDVGQIIHVNDPTNGIDVRLFANTLYTANRTIKHLTILETINQPMLEWKIVNCLEKVGQRSNGSHHVCKRDARGIMCKVLSGCAV